MKTTKPISTISYNSAGYLLGTLKKLEQDEFVAFWVIIEHQPEDDENKSHFHVYIEPAKAVDTNWLRKKFIEPDNEHPNEPRGVMPFHSSKFVDWYWYGLHDKAYLAGKKMSRKHHYEPFEMLTSDTEVLAEMVRQNPNPKTELLRVTELLAQGFTPMEIAIDMNVPLRNLAYFLQGVSLLKSEITYRDGRPNHEEPIAIGEKNDEKED